MCESLIFTQKTLFRDREHPQESVITDEASRRTADLDSANLGGGGGGIVFQLSTFAQQPDVRRPEEMDRPRGAYAYEVRNNLGFLKPPQPLCPKTLCTLNLTFPPLSPYSADVVSAWPQA